MLAALIHSTSPCVGPKVNRRNFTIARIIGATEDDLIRVGSSSVRGCVDIALDVSRDKVFVEHIEASGEPVNVMLV